MEYKGRITAILTVVFIHSCWIIYSIFSNTIDHVYILFQILLFLVEFIIIYWLGTKLDTYKSLSERDFLTKLYNRRYIFIQFPKEVRRLQKDEKNNIFVIDINDFKIINDHYGHKMGDYVLKGIANALTMSMHESDVIARIGGDEFLILAPSKKIIPTEDIYKRIEATLHKLSDKIGINISISIGKSIYPDRSSTLDGLIKLADIKMYVNKGLNKQSSEKINAEHNNALKPS